MPVYIEAVRAAPVLEALCHRVVWALAFLLGLSPPEEPKPPPPGHDGVRVPVDEEGIEAP